MILDILNTPKNRIVLSILIGIIQNYDSYQNNSFPVNYSIQCIIEVSAQTEAGLTTVTINAIGGLQYDLVRFKVKPGAKVEIILINNDDMTHNLVITAPRAREEVVNAVLPA